MSLQAFIFLLSLLLRAMCSSMYNGVRFFTILYMKGHIFGKMWISKTPCVSIKLNSNSKVSLSMSLGCFPDFKIYKFKFTILLRNVGKENKSSLL